MVHECQLQTDFGQSTFEGTYEIASFFNQTLLQKYTPKLDTHFESNCAATTESNQCRICLSISKVP